MTIGMARLARPDALEVLKGFGISGTDVYLIDAIPLIEMMWADNHVGDAEWRLVEDFIRRHVDNLNAVAKATVVTTEDGLAFVRRFSSVRPAPELLRALRQLVGAVSLSTSDVEVRDQRRRAMVDFCLDIAAASVADQARERFCLAEKQCLIELLSSLR